MTTKKVKHEELAKLDKLLDKIGAEMRKKRDEGVYNQTEKLVEHMKKTTEVYSLIFEEIVGSLYVMGHTEHTDLLKKLFKGIQHQVSSVLKFSLKYYVRKSSELGGKDKGDKSARQDDIPVLLDKKTGLEYCSVKGQTTQPFHASIVRSGSMKNVAKPVRPGLSLFERKNSQHSNHTNSFEVYNAPPRMAGSFYGEQGPTNMSAFNAQQNYAHNHSFSVNMNQNYNTYYNEYSYHTPGDTQIINREDAEMNREIDELLQGKKNLESIAPSNVSTNLKQVLKGLEGFKKKVKALGEGDDEGDEEPKLDFNGLTGGLIGAFDKAQKKTAKRVISYAMTKTVDSTAMVETGTMPDPDMLDAEKRHYRRDLEQQLAQKIEEVGFAKKKIASLEQDRNSLHDKYTKLSVEHARCDQAYKELKLKLTNAEKEIAYLKQIVEDVKKGKVDRLFLSKEQEAVLKKNLMGDQSAEQMNQVLMQKLQETRKEAKIMKYQLENGGKKPPADFFDNDEDTPSLTELKAAIATARSQAQPQKKVRQKVDKNGKIINVVEDDGDDVGPVEAVEVEEEVMVNGKLVKVKKTVFRQKKKKVIINANGEEEEVEEYVDVDEDDVTIGKDGQITKATKGVKITADGKKMVKMVTLDKNGREIEQWVEVPSDVDVGDGSDGSGPTQITTKDGKVLKKVVKKDKNGREVVEWIDIAQMGEDEGDIVETANGGIIKVTKSGRTLAKVVTKDRNGKEVVQWVEVPAGVDMENMTTDARGVVTMKATNGKILTRVVTKDRNGKDVIKWVETTQDTEEAGSSRTSVAGANSTRRTINPKDRKGRAGGNGVSKGTGMVMMEEEVEEVVTVVDENGNLVKVKRKVIKQKHVKKYIDENGEEVVEEEIIDPVTGEKKVIKRKVKDLKNVKIVDIGATEGDDEGESVYTAHGTKRKIKHKEIQTQFGTEEMIKAALESAGIKGAALTEINKLLAKQGIDILKPKLKIPQEGEDCEYINIPGQGRKKVVYNKGEEVEEIEFVTKDGRVVKKRVPKGSAKEDYEVNEDGELVYKGKNAGKFKSYPNSQRKYSVNKYGAGSSDESDFEGRLDGSMISGMSYDDEGNYIKKKKLKKNVPANQGGTKKMTLDDYIRKEEELEKNGPPLTKEEAQTRAMYKAMLTKAKGDPKLMQLFKNFMKERGINSEDDENFVVDFNTFKEYVKHLKEGHRRCGDNCIHLQRFYSRIGYYTIWNHRMPLEMKKPELSGDTSAGKTMMFSPPKLPMINNKKLVSPKAHN